MFLIILIGLQKKIKKKNTIYYFVGAHKNIKINILHGKYFLKKMYIYIRNR